ncbi:MAG: diguanylate cyclase [Methylophaga sp.]|nr:MAG: diguanylate cyclase [Methylophaga sp.]
MKPLSNFRITITFLLGLASSVILAWFFYTAESQAINTEFNSDVDAQLFSIEKEISLNFEALYAIKGLYDSSDNVTASEFNRFATEVLSRYPNIQALEWVPRVNKIERSKIELERQQQYPHFEITERDPQGKIIRAKQRNEYFPVYYIEPLTGNEPTFGFDLASNTERLKALTQSRETGSLTASSSITLVQDNITQQAFLAFLPIYHGMPTTAEKRYSQLAGFALGIFKIDDLINNSTLNTSIRGINLTLIDETSVPTKILHSRQVSNISNTNTSIHYMKQLNLIGGRQWTILATPSKGYIYERRSSTPLVIFLLGFIIVSYSVVNSLFIAHHAEVIQKAVEERTFELKKAQQELEKISMQDGLTGIANRRHFDIYLEQEWAHSIREQQPISLIMIDIDYFKQFNDTYGHLAGDHCLKDIAYQLHSTLRRTTDLATRYGGEEFAIILPNTSDAYILSELCRENIENLHIPHSTSKTANHVTISVGFGTIFPKKGASVRELIILADKALYKAKKAGRNTVCSL